MTDALTATQVVSNALYIVLALVSLRLWMRNRTAPGVGWVAATFVSGGLIVGLGLILGPEPVDTPAWITKIFVVLLLALPLSLHRFVSTLAGGSRWLGRIAELGAAGIVVVTLLLPSFPGPDEEPTAGWAVFTFAFMAVWLVLNARAAWVLMRAAKGQPNVIRRRLQVLAGGAVGLGLAIVLPSLAPTSSVLAVGGAVAGAVSGVMFLVGFAPPSLLRAWWRESEELALHDATQQLMLASHRDEVAKTLLPCMTALVGARGSALLDADGKVIGRDGEIPGDPAEALHGSSSDVLVVPVAGKQSVVLWTSPWSPMLGEDERRLLARLTVLSDLALDRADLFEAERRAKHQAELANEEVEAFVATITHDLRNPLTTVGGMADLLLGPLEGDLTDRARDFVERIQANAKYMGALVDDILALAEVGQVKGRLEPVALQEIGEAISVEVTMREPLTEVAVHQLPVVLGDPVRLRRLFENIVGNAMKHGGREDIRIDVTAVETEGDFLELRFLDNGRGVPPEASERVFGVFERLEGRGKGTGLGLAICRKLVEQWGGSMWFATSQGGADVRIRVPGHLVVGPGTGTKAAEHTAVATPNGSDPTVNEDAGQPVSSADLPRDRPIDAATLPPKRATGGGGSH